jgi:hypothetical protein
MKIKKDSVEEKIYYPEVIPDNMEELIKNFRETTIMMKKEANADRRHRELMEALENSKADPVINRKVYFDKATNTLFIGNTPYKTKGFRLQLLTLFFKNEKAKIKDWQLDNLFDRLEGKESTATEDYQKFSKRLYSACDGINKQISIKTGINDFLIFTKKTAKLNPKYI